LLVIEHFEAVVAHHLSTQQFPESVSDLSRRKQGFSSNFIAERCAPTFQAFQDALGLRAQSQRSRELRRRTPVQFGARTKSNESLRFLFVSLQKPRPFAGAYQFLQPASLETWNAGGETGVFPNLPGQADTFKTLQGHKLWSNAEAADVVGRTRESTQEDLFRAIEKSDFPKWKMQVQIMTDAQAQVWSERTAWNPFDLTKVWPHGDFPVFDIGTLELNRNPDNYFAEIEQAAFAPSNIVPGIGFSPDKMLQGRLFSYGDTQRYRLGVNFNHIPVNAPKCPFHSYHRDGAMRTDDNLDGTVSFHPNSAGLWSNQSDFTEPPMPVDGEGAHWDHRVDEDYWEQPGNLFRLMTKAKQQALFENTARAMGDAREHIKQRHVENCMRAESGLRRGRGEGAGDLAVGAGK
jgi:hypothetical protein